MQARADTIGELITVKKERDECAGRNAELTTTINACEARSRAKDFEIADLKVAVSVARKRSPRWLRLAIWGVSLISGVATGVCAGRCDNRVAYSLGGVSAVSTAFAVVFELVF